MKQVEVVKNIESSIEALYEVGARHVMVVDLPDFGKIPGYSPDPKAASKVSRKHNTLLIGMLARLHARYPELHLIPVKLDPLFEQLEGRMNMAVPLIEVFAAATPGISACLAINPISCIDMPPFLFNADFGFIFWDAVHPTTEAHRYLGSYMYDMLASEYE